MTKKGLTVMGLSLFLLIFFSEQKAMASEVLDRAQREHWFEDRQWLRLVQYHPHFFGGYKSSGESDKFFLAPKGKSRPDLELTATLLALQENTRTLRSQDGRFEDPVGCVFPARKLWLEKKAGIKFPNPQCERFNRFKEILQPQSLTYVFSSYYLNNPASAFGHTFLRVNKAPSAINGERFELADYGVGYAAVKTSENPFVYSFLGVSGLMPGAFDINPYYYKVREYNDFESRDLWEYDLTFTPEEVEMVIAYIWELLDVNFNYHYFTENCSYRILSVLEVARPSLELTDHLKSQVMPADTVQTLFQQQGLVGRIHFRPSIRATFEQRYRGLSDEGKSRLRGFARNESIAEMIQDLEPVEKRGSLDTAMDYLDYRYSKEILRKEEKYIFKKDVLRARAELGGASALLKLSTAESEAPHEAQGSRRWGFGYREWNKRNFYLLEMKAALHDLLDPKLGYPPTAEITMGYLGLSLDSTSQELALDRAILYEVVSLSPLNDFNRDVSWRLKFSLERGFENNCLGLCRWTELSGGSGLTTTVWSDLDLSVWLRLTTQTSTDFQGDTWRIGAGPGLSARWNRNAWAVMAEIYDRYDYKGLNPEFRQSSLGINWSLNKNLSLRFRGAEENSLRLMEARLLYYY
ncbi:MAG TPA: DUF4105 domain-containing protein [Pseudobdellovibrionaceae bacterium]